MKTVIIPTCGNAALIEKCSIVADLWPGEKMHYIFLDIRPIPDNYNDLMTISRDGNNCGSFDETFCEAVNAFGAAARNRSAVTDHFYGDSVPMFKNYLEYRNADVVVFDQEQCSGSNHFRQQDIFKMVIRCGAEVIYMTPGRQYASVNKVARPVIRMNTSAGRDLKINGASFSKDNYPAVDFVAGRTAKQPARGIVTGIATGAVAGAGSPSNQAGTATSSDKKAAPQYQSVDQLLHELQTTISGDEILIRQMSRLNRYFLKQSAIQQMLTASNRDLLWIRK